MNRITIAAALLLAGAACKRSDDAGVERKIDSATPANVPADNTKKNERDRDDSALTPGDQAENEADRTITQRVRQEVVGLDSLSMTAKNVKIITANGVVTLRGPVKSAAEKAEIARLAHSTAGVSRVDNQLEIAPEESQKGE